MGGVEVSGTCREMGVCDLMGLKYCQNLRVRKDDYHGYKREASGKRKKKNSRDRYTTANYGRESGMDFKNMKELCRVKA